MDGWMDGGRHALHVTFLLDDISIRLCQIANILIKTTVGKIHRTLKTLNNWLSEVTSSAKVIGDLSFR